MSIFFRISIRTFEPMWLPDIEEVRCKPKIDLSIVCASYRGAEKLPKMICSILRSSVIPKQIVLAIGFDESPPDWLTRYSNFIEIKIVNCELIGQAVQRLAGLEVVTNPWVMQIDDDMELHVKSIDLAFSLAVHEGKKTVVGLLQVDPHGNYSAKRWNFYYSKYWIFRVVVCVLNNFRRPGFMTLTASGRIIPLMPVEVSSFDADWCGGCMVYHRTASKEIPPLRIEGKAYYDDVYFSHSLKRMQYRVLVSTTAKVTHPSTPQITWKIFIETVPAQYRLVSKFKLSRILFGLDVLIFSIIFIIFSIRSKVRFWHM